MAMFCGSVPKNQPAPKTDPVQQHLSSTIHPLIAALWGADNGHHFIATQDPRTSAFHTHPAENAEVACRVAAENTTKGLNVFHACSTYRTAEKRTAENVESVKAFWLDIDCGKLKAESGQGYATQVEAANAVSDFCSKAGLLTPNFLLNSGNGLHAYWILEKSIGAQLWKAFASKLKELTKALGLKADPSRTADPASLMRFPGTLNLKGEKPLPVELIGAPSESIRVQPMLDAIGAAHERFCGKAGEQKPALTAIANALSGPFAQAEFDRLKSALTVLNPDCEDHTWKFHRLVVLANLARQHPEWADRLYELARDWSSGALAGKTSRAWTTPGNTNGRTGEQAFDPTWQRFVEKEYSGDKPVTVGTIYKDAGKEGWRYARRAPIATTQNSEQFQKEDHVQATRSMDIIPAKLSTLTPLESIQERYCLVKMDAKFWVFDQQNLSALTADGLALKPQFYNQKEGALLVQRALRELGAPEASTLKESRQFFTCPKTICYDGIEFNPRSTSRNKLNLWVGPALIPKQGGWVLIRAFLLEIICNGDQVAHDYLISYLSHALLFPEEKPGVMIILLGGQGVGKGTLGKILRCIWSATYHHIHKIEDVTGNFNATLERAFIVFLDEALFVGDRKASDSLKSLVTENVVQINEKYQPARQTKSYHRFFAATNAEHFKNTERDDRRDFVLKISEARKGDHTYWTALNTEIENGGVAAMMHDLLAMDLSGFNVRAKPTTAALIEQKIHSLGLIERWWCNVLMTGDVGVSEEPAWADFIATKAIIENAIELSGGRIHRNPSDVEAVATMTKLCPSVSKVQRQDSLERRRGLSLPDIQTARQEFEQYIGGLVLWEPVEG